MELLLALAIGIIFLYHGWKKFPYLTGTAPAGLPPTLGKILAFSESLGGIALIISVILPDILVTLAALGLAIIMCGALYYKIIKWKAPFSGANGWEFDLVLLAGLLTLL